MLREARQPDLEFKANMVGPQSKDTQTSLVLRNRNYLAPLAIHLNKDSISVLLTETRLWRKQHSRARRGTGQDAIGLTEWTGSDEETGVSE